MTVLELYCDAFFRAAKGGGALVRGYPVPVRPLSDFYQNSVQYHVVYISLPWCVYSIKHTSTVTIAVEAQKALRLWTNFEALTAPSLGFRLGAITAAAEEETTVPALSYTLVCRSILLRRTSAGTLAIRCGGKVAQTILW